MNPILRLMNGSRRRKNGKILKKIKYDFKDKEKEDMMSYDEGSYKKSGDDIISSILASIVFCACLLWIAFSTPDDFRVGGMFFDKYPWWMDVVYVFGITAVSALIAFIVLFLSVSILNGTWLRKKMREPKVKRTYKF